MPAPLVLVTGGNKGIGYGIVKLLFKRGVESIQCIFTSRTQANGQEAIESLMKVKQRTTLHISIAVAAV